MDNIAVFASKEMVNFDRKHKRKEKVGEMILNLLIK